VDQRKFRITLQEGRNRQIRRMCEALGYTVRQLHREEVAGITLNGLRGGQWKQLSVAEMRVVIQVLSDADQARKQLSTD
jgi:23S rRNA pseudouridine2604 synthase